MNHLTRIAIEASLNAGKAILEVFNSDDFGVRIKSDQSPLTDADLKSHHIIDAALRNTGIPVLSEEGEQLTYDERKTWDELWIVDPLDGTKEFVKRSGEFTVNIALVRQQKPVMGVVFAPVLNDLYWGDENGAYKIQLQADWISKGTHALIAELNAPKLPIGSPDEFTVVASLSHFSEETERFIKAVEQKEKAIKLASKGSSLKMCLIAEGSAHLYPRFAPTMEWDTAAGQAIIEAAGGQLYDCMTKRPMCYNRKELLNNSFVAVSMGVDVKEYIF